MLTEHDSIYLPKLHKKYSKTDQPLSKNFPNSLKIDSIPYQVYTNGKVSVLAEKFHKNWLDKKANESKFVDDSLTNLNWLNNVPSILGPESPSNSPNNLLNQANSQLLPNIERSHHNDILMGKISDFSNNLIPNPWFTHHFDSALKDGGLLDPLVRHDYKTNWSGKPPFSYATLICMAMRELNKMKITLSDIYGWITDNFIYYRLSDSSWQNSVRHNLSLNKCFEKVPRNKDERGKGGFWRINPKYADRLESNLIKYRRQFPLYNMPKIANGLPAASTLLSRTSNSNISYQESVNTENDWSDQTKTTNSFAFRDPQPIMSEGSFKNKKWWESSSTPYLPNISINNNNNNGKLISPSAFYCLNTDTVSQDDYCQIRKHSFKILNHSQTYRNCNATKLQSLDEFRTSETGQKVDTQMRAQITPNQSPTMYSLLNQLTSPPSHVSVDDIDSAASSSFDAELTANTGSCATLHSHSDDPDESLRFTAAGIGEDFIVNPDDYLNCDSLRGHDHLFDSVNSQFI